MPLCLKNILLWALISAPALFSACTSTKKYESLLAEYRALKREHGETASGLSRDNAVLYGEKIELEKQVSLQENTIENLEARLATELESHCAYRQSAEQQISNFQSMVQACREKSTHKIKDLHERHEQTVDSLISRLDTLTAQLAARRKSHSAQVQTLKNELARRRYTYEKELYALERVKEELFAKLQEKETKIQRLLIGNDYPADTVLSAPKGTEKENENATDPTPSPKNAVLDTIDKPTDP
ncbi:MAG: hypothetical protein GF344_05005 [Chitinivibrionales bacterium]|nr:hypothetical protein [Chitinivibrionales bacterium]MBD3356359.1 hypothetical protein [Chitinivibrionales bacterium]